MQQPAVGDVDPAGLDDALSQILPPRAQLADDIRAGHDVQVAADRGVSKPKSASQLGSVPGLPMIVGQHCPEVMKEPGRQGDTEAGQVPFDE